MYCEVDSTHDPDEYCHECSTCHQCIEEGREADRSLFLELKQRIAELEDLLYCAVGMMTVTTEPSAKEFAKFIDDANEALTKGEGDG